MTRDELVSIIEQAAAAEGVPATALLAIAHLESRGNVNAKNPNSSASGPFQFVDSTARDYGLTGAKRNDPTAQAYAAAKMMSTNMRSLERVLGREPSAGELYLAHQQGLGGASALLKNPSRNAIDVLAEVYGDRAKAEKAVKLNGGTAAQNSQEFSGHWVNKFNNAAARIPPGSVPNTVGTQLDVSAPKVAPKPADLTPAVVAARNRVTPQTPSPAITAARTPAVSSRSAGDSLALDPVRGVELPRVTAYTAPNGQIMSMPEFAKNSVPGRLAGEDAVKPRKVIEPSGVMRVSGPTVIAGSVQLPAGVRPNVTIPEMPAAPTAKIDVVGKMPAFGDVAMLARQNVPAASTAPKEEERLVAQAVGLTPRAGTVQPNKQQVEAATGFRLGGEKSALTSTEVEVANPAYARLLERVKQGELELNGLAPSGMPLSRDGRARYDASLAAIQKLRAELAGTAQTVKVQRTTRSAQAQPVTQRAAAPAMTAVQRLQAQGMSPADAYAAANAQAAQRAKENATRAPKSDLMDRIVSGNMWAAHNSGGGASSLVG